jgi:hypothetical protein
MVKEPAYLVDYSLHMIIMKGNLDRIATAVKLDGVPAVVRDQVNSVLQGTYGLLQEMQDATKDE